MNSRQHEDSESERRRQPQSLNQKNAQLLQKLARLRAQRQSSSSNPHSIQLNSAFQSVAEPMDPPPQNEGKGLGKVKISGRRRLCKVTNDNEETLSSHSPASDDDSAVFESSGDNYTRENNVECRGLYKNNRLDRMASSVSDERNINVDELSSRIHSLDIKNSKPAEIGQPKFVLEPRTKIINTFNSFKDILDDESSQDEEYAYDDENHKVKCSHGEKSAYHCEETKNAVNSPVYSSDAPEYESAHSVLSCKVDDGEDNSAESSQFTSFSVKPDARDDGTSVEPVKSKMETTHDTFEEDDLEDIPSKVVKQNTRVSQVYTTVEVSSSVEELDSVLSESENVFSDAAESAKIRTKSHASTTRRSSAWNPYEVVDSDEEEVTAEVDSIIFSDDKKTYTLTGKIAKKLYAHQREGIKWFWNLHCKCKGGILGDDMGLGKTMQVAAFLAGLFSSSLIKRALIVAPKTLLAHWLKELSFVGLGRKTRDYSGSPGNTRDYALLYVIQTGGILLTTYDVVRNNWKAIRGDYQGSDEHDESTEDVPAWDYVILDEGHIIKNPSTQRAKSLREIPSKHRIIISGTPIQNNLREMWALFDFCCPGLLGDKKEFKARYEDLILRANDKKASERHKWIGSKAAEELRIRIEPYFLRRMKSQVFPQSGDGENIQLAKKDDIIVWLKLTENQRELYRAFLNSEAAISSVEGSALAALTVLKKICDHPGLLTKKATDDIAEGMESMLRGEDDVPTEDMQEEVALAERTAVSLAFNGGLEDLQSKSRSVSCKITFLMALLENLITEEHRVLIFAQTRKMLNIIQEEIKCQGYDFLRIDGTTKAHDREKLVNEFQSNDATPIFLLTSQVGGLGLTLTGADRVVVVDPAWNPSTDNQSVDRAYRIGQLRNVLVYRLMTCGTIEEKIYRKQVFKGGLFRTATEDRQQTRYFSQQELRELFTIPESGFDVSLTQKQLHEEHDNQHEIDDILKKHIEFLEDQGIAGVSHHNLLYSKTETVQPLPAGEEDAVKWDMRRYEFTGPVYRYPPSKPPQADVGAGSEFAFRPQDHRLIRHGTPVIDDDELKRRTITENISRLEKTLADKDLVVRLPDKGENLQRRMRDLTNQLKNLESISSGSHVVVLEHSSDTTISGDMASVISLDSGGKNQMDVNSLKENLNNSIHNNDNVINLDDISQGIRKLSV